MSACLYDTVFVKDCEKRREEVLQKGHFPDYERKVSFCVAMHMRKRSSGPFLSHRKLRSL